MSFRQSEHNVLGATGERSQIIDLAGFYVVCLVKEVPAWSRHIVGGMFEALRAESIYSHLTERLIIILTFHSVMFTTEDKKDKDKKKKSKKDKSPKNGSDGSDVADDVEELSIASGDAIDDAAAMGKCGLDCVPL